MSKTHRENYTPERGRAISERNLARSKKLLRKIYKAANAPEVVASRVAKLKAHFMDPEVSKKLVAARWSGDARKRMSEAMSGRVLRKKHIKNLKKAWKLRGPVPQWAKDKMRESRMAYLARNGAAKTVQA